MITQHLKGIDPGDTGWDQYIHTTKQPGDVEIQTGIYVPATVVPDVPAAQKPLLTQTENNNYLPYIIIGAIVLILVS